ncbi:chromosome condensation regulator RCC1 [Psychrobacter sp. I-STPA6b]|uniref:RCC1 domain-containing protein n=1 Tax=Psychrobacter sp. I-STPA6b TaxID=2585718 RepID=UPI001D0C8B03|nr:chromosome condensation regulator RCC1 [Psychrobacter sp. I-STPA6b]
MRHTHSLLLASMISALMLSGCSGGSNHHHISEPDTTKPTLTIDSDLTNVTTNQDSITITGTVADNAPLSGLILSIQSAQSNDTQTVKVSDKGEFSAKIPLQVGDNELTITATDVAGNKVVYQATVFVDKVAPSIVLADEGANQVSRTTQTAFKGKVSDDGELAGLSVQLLLNKTANNNSMLEAITIDAKGEFEVVTPLQAGDNEIAITVMDKAGNQTTKTQHVYFGHTLTAANSHTGALVDGKLYAWGRNNFGQVGRGDVTSIRDDGDAHSISPQLITNAPKNIVSISFNQNHSSLLTKDGSVYTWGSDGDGELGRGDTGRSDCGRKTENCRLDIGKVNSLSDVVAISSGYGHRLVLNKAGEVWAFGDNGEGQLGVDGVKNSSTPVQVDFSSQANVGKIIQVVASSTSSYALDDKGQVWAWGSNKYGNFGMGKVCERGDNPKETGCIPSSFKPLQVPLAEAVKIKELAVGRDHVLALTDMGEVYSWGLNASSQVGYNSKDMPDTQQKWDRFITTPTLLPWSTDKQSKHVYANGNTSYVMKKDGKVYPWGMYGESGADGRPNYMDLAEPTDKLPSLTNVVDMGVGALHQLAKREDGGIFSWGWSFEGSLGGGDTVTNIWMYNTPIALKFPI